jgi:hypothetical protein
MQEENALKITPLSRCYNQFVSKNQRGIKQKTFDLTIILVILAGLTIYAYQKGRLNFTHSNDIPTAAIPFPTIISQTRPKTYVDNNFLYQFIYEQKPEGCDKQITVSDPWVMNDNVYGVDIYCNEGENLVQVLAEKSNKDITNWWYSLLSDNKPFFEKYGEMKDIVFADQKAKQISYQKNGENEHFNQTEIIFHRGEINYLVVALDYMCTDCWQGTFGQEVLKSFELTSEETQNQM